MGGRSELSGYLEEGRWQPLVDEAVRLAIVNLDARPCPAGTMDVVLGPGWPGILLHEAVGHGLEGDFNRKETSAFAGRLSTSRIAASRRSLTLGSIAAAPPLTSAWRSSALL